MKKKHQLIVWPPNLVREWIVIYARNFLSLKRCATVGARLCIGWSEKQRAASLPTHQVANDSPPRNALRSPFATGNSRFPTQHACSIHTTFVYTHI
ncbi:hypothetical protein CEXT_162681 [Caerostris extrusa]|uniref:Uncharacterized protein n=1 Tax=Caerostris extrusa TaxID=172846 RepID=A0AAV4QR62_CAEEX|nr:hypothetical protein CEXT_162681 [Caerostris extrusa]